MVIVDADYNCIYVDIGYQGRVSDGGVFQNCELYQRLTNNALNVPAPRALFGRRNEVPYVFVGDAAFPLTENLMKPYQGTYVRGSPERIFNYRLSRSRRIVENAFGIMSSVFRVLRKPMLLEADKATLIVMTVACLHNFLRKSKSFRGIYTPVEAVDREMEGSTISGT
ncbi:uncharacterized protein isoform X1 [Leptinotarsa decemlineata]|uniref:uncharacterized protein isoform X1 n=1 Tax=Leptinotarsa decemlineata TaxID=7539 RepID=UPI003D30819D